jgi:hypothetical protein
LTHEKAGLAVLRGRHFAAIRARAVRDRQRQGWLLDRRESLTTLPRSDPGGYDEAEAAFWLWGRSVWLGGSWCHPGERVPRKVKVALRGGETGPGIGQLPP